MLLADVPLPGDTSEIKAPANMEVFIYKFTILVLQSQRRHNLAFKKKGNAMCQANFSLMHKRRNRQRIPMGPPIAGSRPS